MGPPKRCLLSFQSKSQVSVIIPKLDVVCLQRRPSLHFLLAALILVVMVARKKFSPGDMCPLHGQSTLNTRNHTTRHGHGAGVRLAL